MGALRDSYLVQRRVGRTVTYMLHTVFFVVMIVPLVVMIFTALKGESELYLQSSFELLPRAWRFGNFVDAMAAANWGRYFFNSLLVTSVATVGSLFLNSLAGFSFAALRFPGRNFLFFFLLIGIMIPYQVTIVPQYILMKSIPLFGGNSIVGSGGTGWLDSHWALIVPQLAGSFGVFLCRQYYLGIPRELLESAKIDGASSLKAFLRIYVPLSKPVFATLGILKCVYVWNDFFYPLIMTTSDSMKTVQLGLQTFRSVALVRWDLMMAATTLVCIPLIAAFLLFQRWFINSAVASSVKG